MSLFQLALLIHVAAGTIALISYWTVGLMKKGTPRHRQIGQVYLLAMVVVVLSGIPLVVTALLEDKPIKAAFLGFLLLLVSQACWSAWRAIRDRREPARFFGPVYWSLSAATALAGMAMMVLGLRIGQPIFVVFGGVGLTVGLGTVYSLRRSRNDAKWWLKEHFGAMIGNGIATHIAFFGIGLRSALPMIDPQTLQLFAWFTPLAGAAVASWWLGRKYGGSPKPRIQTSPSLNQPSPVPR